MRLKYLCNINLPNGFGIGIFIFCQCSFLFGSVSPKSNVTEQKFFDGLHDKSIVMHCVYIVTCHSRFTIQSKSRLVNEITGLSQNKCNTKIKVQLTA